MKPKHQPDMSSDFKVEALLNCGASIVIQQRKPLMVIEIEVKPKAGETIDHTAWVDNNSLKINLTPESLIGLRHLLNHILVPKKTFLQKLFLRR